MRFNFRCVVYAALIASSAQLTFADEINAAESKKLRQICSDLVDQPFLSANWDKLRPYLRNKRALDSVEAICSFSCNGSIPLRDNLWLNFVYVNPQKIGKPWGPKDALVYSVTLTKNKRDIFHREIEPKPAN